MGIRVLSSTSELEEVRELWELLWEECDQRTPFLSYDWVHTWLEVYGDARRPHILVVSSGRHPVAIVPLALVRHSCGPLGVTALETAGGDSRNLVGLVRPGYGRSVARAVSTHLSRCIQTVAVCAWLRLVPSETSFLSELRAAIDEEGVLDFRSEVSSIAPYSRLPAEWNDFFQTLSSHRRKTLRRAYRQLRERHTVAYERSQPGTIASDIEHLFQLHQDRWNAVGIRGIFADEPSRRFHMLVARRLAARGWADLTRFSIDGEVVSAHLVVTLDGVLYLLRSGRTMRYGEYSIGHLHDMLMLQRAIAGGASEVDFLQGSEPYKFYWARSERQYLDVVLTRRSRGGLLAVATMLILRVLLFIEHRHTVRELASILRIRWREDRELRKIRRARSGGSGSL